MTSHLKVVVEYIFFPRKNASLNNTRNKGGGGKSSSSYTK